MHSIELLNTVSNLDMVGFNIIPAHTRTTSILTQADKLGALKVRLGFGRMHYTISPGLYSIGNPNADSQVLVTSNYKLTFDSVRKTLEGFNGWIVVLDTKGVNVWCAAGKGTFGTNELVSRIKAVNLAAVVSHRKIIVPQLGASGIAAHEVLKQTGFKVIYGPVRATDIKTFIANNYKATPEMRTVTFPLVDRLVLTPVDLFPPLKKSLSLFGLFFILNALGFGRFTAIDIWAIWGAIVMGAFFVPVLLPFIPFKAFSIKGGLMGGLWTLFIIMAYNQTHHGLDSWAHLAAYATILPTISAYLAMNFTGASTYTSFSGVKKEMKIALPAMLTLSGAGVVFLIIDMFISRGL